MKKLIRNWLIVHSVWASICIAVFIENGERNWTLMLGTLIGLPVVVALLLTLLYSPVIFLPLIWQRLKPTPAGRVLSQIADGTGWLFGMLFSILILAVGVALAFGFLVLTFKVIRYAWKLSA